MNTDSNRITNKYIKDDEGLELDLLVGAECFFWGVVGFAVGFVLSII